MATGGMYGGYDYNFADGAPSDRLICAICTLVARDPQQTNCCGNTFCKTCLSQQSQVIGQNARCPLCNKQPLQYFNDAKLNREIISLKVYCTNSEEGCEWKGTINETDTSIEAHLNSCPYQLIPCTNECGENIRRSTLETHLTESCPERLVNCQYCGKQDKHQIIISSSHLDECRYYPLKCSNEECEEVIPRRLLASHRKKCPKAIITCEYNTVGCDVKMKKEEQEKHNDESIKHHLAMAVKRIASIQTHNEVLRFDNFSIQEQWYSPGFYTSPGGYKMRLCVYTKEESEDEEEAEDEEDTDKNDDNNDNHFISCYINLMSGEYDDTLEWPFQGKVTIELLNQLEDKNHKKYTTCFNESVPEECKQRVPKGEDDAEGWGTCEFISHSKLEYNPITNCQYLKDDSLYFRVSVKVTSKTKPWLAVSANGSN